VRRPRKEATFTSERDGHHILRHWLAQADPGIEALRNDIHERWPRCVWVVFGWYLRK
jgi:hypothetical protein